MDMESLGDWDLLLQRERMNEAFAVLFERHKDMIFRLAVGFTGNPDLADEITQEVFVRMYEGRKRWRPRAKFTSWIYKVTLNTSRELLRKSAGERTALERVRRETAYEPETFAPVEGDFRLKDILRILPDRHNRLCGRTGSS